MSLYLFAAESKSYCSLPLHVSAFFRPQAIPNGILVHLLPLPHVASYEADKTSLLKTLYCQFIYKLISSFTEVRQVPASSREWTEVQGQGTNSTSSRCRAGRSLAMSALSCVWCKKPRVGWLQLWPNISMQLRTLLSGNASLAQR